MSVMPLMRVPELPLREQGDLTVATNDADVEGEAVPPRLRVGELRDPRRAMRAKEKWIERAILLCAAGSILAVVLIFVFIGREALPILFSAEVKKEANLYLFFVKKVMSGNSLKYVWQPVSDIPKFSFIPLLTGTFKATFVGLVFSVPLGLAAALFTAEFAPQRLREMIKPVIEMLAGIPSVVLGFFALMVLATWLQDAFHLPTRLNAINVGIALGVAVIPLIFTVAEDALTAVPTTYRHAALALGATRWQTAWRVALPAALPGVYAAIALGFGRCVGETMVVLMASGNAAITSMKLTDSVRTMSATIAAELGEVVWGSPHWNTLFFLGSLLFVITFLANLAGDVCVHRLKKKLAGG